MKVMPCTCGVPRTPIRASTVVDMLVWCATTKPALRSQAPEGASDDGVLQEWARSYDADFAMDRDGYFCVSRTIPAHDVLGIDSSPEPHEYEFGVLLGYPTCCSAAGAAVGEANLDLHLSTTVAQWQFPVPYHRIDPTAYISGAALICHIPCAPTCESSLAIATKVRDHAAVRPRCVHIEALWRSGLLD